MAEQRRYQKTTDTIRRRVIDAFERGDDAYAIGYANGMKRRTIGDLLKRGTEYLQPRGGAKRIKITENIKERLEEVISETPDKTLQELADSIEESHNVHVTPQAIGKALDGMSYSLKELRVEPQTMNSEENKLKRLTYSQRIMDLAADGCRIIWIDESNINIHCKRSNGRALKGQRALIQATTTKGANLHIIGAVTNMEMITHKTKRGAYKGTDFDIWMEELVAAIPVLPEKVIIVCDNAPVHSRAEQALTSAMERQYNGNPPYQCEILRLAPYSPMLNPIESLWSTVKNNAKAQLRNRRQEILEGPQMRMTLQNHRLGILEEVVRRAMIESAIPNMLLAYSHRVNRHLARALQQLDMLIGE